MVRKDRCCTEQLFREHRPCKKMRPGRSAERQKQIRMLALRLLVTIRGADQETGLALPVVSPVLELFCKIDGGKRCPPLVQQDCDGVGARRRAIAAPVGQLRYLGRPLYPLQIALDQLGLWRAADLPARNDMEQQPIAR